MRQRTAYLSLLLGAYLAWSPSVATGTIRYVKQGGTGNGTSWSNAYGSLQSALAASSSFDQVWVAAGSYVPGQQQTHSFALVNEVSVIGGFYGTPGTEGNPDARDPNPLTNGTVLSGVIGPTSNCFVIVKAQYVNDQTILDGFTITGAVEHGVYISSASPTLTNLRIVGNESPNSGAGLYCAGISQPQVTHCTFTANHAVNYGGAAYVEPSGENPNQPVFAHCVFEANTAVLGGALYLDGCSSYTTVRRCRFIGNVAMERGGAVFSYVSDAEHALRIWDCTFMGNEVHGDDFSGGHGGGAVYIEGSEAWTVLVNCLFVGNTAFTDGGAIRAWSPEAPIHLINCTLYANAALYANPEAYWFASSGGGVCLAPGTQAVVTNCVFWGNSDALGNSELAQIYGEEGSLSVNYTCLQGWTGSYGGTGNHGSAPLFVDPDGWDGVLGTRDDNFRLTAASACLESGDNGAVPGDVTEDLDGAVRLVDGDGDMTVTVDAGAFEYDLLLDCNSNQVPDNEDVAGCSSQDPACQDCNGNGVPDACDIAAQTSADCNENGRPDECDVAAGFANDCQDNGVPDECEFDQDCNGNCVEDAAELEGNDCNDNGVLDACEFGAPGLWMGEDSEAALLINTVYDEQSGQVVRNEAAATQPLPYLWVAASGGGRNSAVRIRTDNWNPPGDEQEGDIIGEYRTAPEVNVYSGNPESEPQSAHGFASDPSRTTVDLDGSAWVGNRAQGDELGMGSVVKIGLVLGGTRVNADRQPDADGGYLAPPFDYCTCEDRDGDGLIRTSRGLGDILPWSNWDGSDDEGGVTHAEDECILRYVRTAGTGVRTVAIDKENNLWVGGYDDGFHEKLDGFSGAQLVEPVAADCGGYGGLIDCDGVLWSARGGAGLWRFDTINLTPIGTCADNCGNYGLGFDPRTGDIWHTGGAYVYRIESAASPLSCDAYYHNGGTSQGVAVDNQGDVWISYGHGKSDPGRAIGRLNPSTSQLVDVPLAPVQDPAPGPTGVAVARDGKVWVTNYQANNVMRIDPSENEVDLTVDLGDGANPYNYSDMTGMVGLHATGTGTWIAVHDSGRIETQWRQVYWNRITTCEQPIYTHLEVSVRADDNEAALAMSPYRPVVNADVLSDPEDDPLIGRFIQVRVRFFGWCPGIEFASPALCDLAVVPEMHDPSDPLCIKGDANSDGYVDGLDIQSFTDAVLEEQPIACLPVLCGADMNSDGRVTLDDVSCFVATLLGGTCQGGGERGIADCNDNGIVDAEDIAGGTSLDCNTNLVPDECDIDPTDPDGNGRVSSDVNSNDVPDECEPDCNGNSIPDAWDISQQTSDDVNSNGIPDECEPDCNGNSIPDAWDLSQSTSADCNLNELPDECEGDCNGNGVPDDCDVDPNDPDGDEEVWEDCNENGVPDACDLSYPAPLGSTDCNDNDVPDECDVAGCSSQDPDCQDCNANGYPDACDIASALSEDLNENGIPDECESGEGLDGGGGEQDGEGEQGGEGEGLDGEDGQDGDDDGLDGGDGEQDGQDDALPLSAEEEAAAWEAYFDWAAQQDWGPDTQTSGSEQFQAMVDKLAELGLPVQQP